MKSNTSFTYGLIAFLVIGIGLIVWASANKPAGTNTATQSKTADMATLVQVQPDDYVIGTTSASVTLIEYLDFECEACRAYSTLVKQLEAEFPNDLRVVKRYFPLPGHRNGMTAALAVEAAGRQGKFNEMHDLLYAEKPKWGEKAKTEPELFEVYAAQIGLDMTKSKADVTSPEVKARIQRDIDSGRALGIQGTPTFILNGEKITNPQGYEAFKQLIEIARDEAKSHAGAVAQ